MRITLNKNQKSLIKILEDFQYPKKVVIEIISNLINFSYTLIQTKKENQNALAEKIEKETNYTVEKNSRAGIIFGPDAYKFRIIKITENAIN